MYKAPVAKSAFTNTSIFRYFDISISRYLDIFHFVIPQNGFKRDTVGARPRYLSILFFFVVFLLLFIFFSGPGTRPTLPGETAGASHRTGVVLLLKRFLNRPGSPLTPYFIKYIYQIIAVLTLRGKRIEVNGLVI